MSRITEWPPGDTAGRPLFRPIKIGSGSEARSLSGYYALKDGTLELSLPIEDLIAGHTTETAFLVK